MGVDMEYAINSTRRLFGTCHEQKTRFEPGQRVVCRPLLIEGVSGIVFDRFIRGTVVDTHVADPKNPHWPRGSRCAYEVLCDWWELSPAALIEGFCSYECIGLATEWNDQNCIDFCNIYCAEVGELFRKIVEATTSDVCCGNSVLQWFCMKKGLGGHEYFKDGEEWMECADRDTLGSWIYWRCGAQRPSLCRIGLDEDCYIRQLDECELRQEHAPMDEIQAVGAFRFRQMRNVFTAWANIGDDEDFRLMCAALPSQAKKSMVGTDRSYLMRALCASWTIDAHHVGAPLLARGVLRNDGVVREVPIFSNGMSLIDCETLKGALRYMMYQKGGVNLLEQTVCVLKHRCCSAIERMELVKVNYGREAVVHTAFPCTTQVLEFHSMIAHAKIKMTDARERNVSQSIRCEHSGLSTVCVQMFGTNLVCPCHVMPCDLHTPHRFVVEKFSHRICNMARVPSWENHRWFWLVRMSDMKSTASSVLATWPSVLQHHMVEMVRDSIEHSFPPGYARVPDWLPLYTLVEVKIFLYSPTISPKRSSKKRAQKSASVKPPKRRTRCETIYPPVPSFNINDVTFDTDGRVLRAFMAALKVEATVASELLRRNIGFSFLCFPPGNPAESDSSWSVLSGIKKLSKKHKTAIFAHANAWREAVTRKDSTAGNLIVAPAANN